MTIECFSQRLLNPFRGIVCTIRFESAEAVTTDGFHWDIYVRNELMLDDLDVEDRHKVLTNDIRYGSWSPQQGLKRGPIYPSDDFHLLEQMGEHVYHALLERHDRLPFPLIDSYELWLLDEQQMPLVLIDSAIDARDIELDQQAEWRPGLRCRQGFNCRAFDILSQQVEEPNAGDYLGRYINRRAGKPASAQWIERQADTSGIGLGGIALQDGLEGRRLAEEDFPALLLKTDGHDTSHAQLVDAFIRWQSPWLLLLPDLDPEQRRDFERQALRQARVVADQYRLYPEIIEPRHINTARVEARMRQGQETKTGNDEDDHSVYYIELTGSE